MDWYWHMIIHAGALYATVGAFLGWRWFDGDSKFERIFFSILMSFLWFFFCETTDSRYIPEKKTPESRTLKRERARMELERRTEEAQVRLLEESAEHRLKMAELHRRRKRAEEIV